MLTQKVADFATAFYEAGGQHATTYNGLIRFLAIICVVLAILWEIYHFTDEQAKASENYLMIIAFKAVKVFSGVTIFISLLMT
jgi:hypothetical protein